MKKLIPVFIALAFGLTGRAQESGQPWYSFSKDGKECIVYKSDLPTPWLNRLSNDVFTTWVTHNGYIESFLLDPQLNGLTNPQNTSGRFYIRDRSTQKYFQVNKPVGNGQWQSRVGLGYNVVSQTVNGLTATATYFVPRQSNVLLMTLRLENTSSNEKSLDVFSEVEWNLGDPVKSFIHRGDGRGGSQFNLYKKVELRNNSLIATQRTWKSTGSCEQWPFTGYFSVSEPVSSFECDKDNFLGYDRDYDKPAALAKERLTNTTFWSQADYPVGVLQNSVTVRAGTSKTLVYALGMARSEDEVQDTIGKYLDVQKAEAVLQRVKEYYDKLITTSIMVQTPDKDNDRILNIWTKYQWRQFFKRSLNNGAYGLGLWSYNLEDETIRTAVEQVILPFDMEMIRSTIIEHFRNQLSDTTQSDISLSAHTMLYKDLGIGGPDSAHKGEQLITHRHKISAFFYPIYFYLLETGDLGLLDETIPFIDGKEATVWQHICTAMTISLRILGNRGLPRLPTGHGDWMDEFTRISSHNSAESVMLAGELGFIIKGFSDIAARSGHQQDADKWMTVYQKMKEAVNDLAWDGNWYIRAFSDRADSMIPVGTHKNDQGSLYLNAQSWAILSGMATRERANRSLESVRSRLMSEFGPMIFSPSYYHYVDYIGTQSIYAPGFRNGCIYLRPTGWAIMAACIAGKPELAYEMYSNAALARRQKNIRQFECEPYVYPECYNGADHRLKGRGEFQWNLGEGAAWMWYAYINYILGIRAEIGGLRIDPQIPPEWKGFKITRPFRGCIYEIEVKNTGKAIRSITVNGKKTSGTLLKGGEPGKTYKVIVNM